jgi:hypothetical protein
VICLSEKKINSSEAARLPENETKVAEFKRRAEAQKAKDQTAAKLFDPLALLQRAGQIHEVQHPTLGLIRYGELVIADSEIINKCKNKADRNAMSIYLMLKKAYPNLPDYTPETISEFNCSFPMLEASELIKFLNEQPGFLLTKSPTGSSTTQTLKTSA